MVSNFNGVTLPGMSPRNRKYRSGTATLLDSGLYHVQRPSYRPFQETVTCFTKDYADIIALEALVPISGNLVIDDPEDPIDLWNVSITGDITVTPHRGGYEYKITFTQGV